MSLGVIIFSRFNSTRLPGKAMIQINGKTLLERVFERAKLIKGVDIIVLATSSLSTDDILVDHLSDKEIKVFRGSLENVADRALKACEFYNIDKFARVCGDRPFFDPNLVSSLIQKHKEFQVDIATTTFPRTYPPGLTVEVLSTKVLREGLPKMKKEEKEHLTTYFYSNHHKYRIYNEPAPTDLNLEGLDLCVDDTRGLQRARWISSRLKCDIGSDNERRNIVELARQWEFPEKRI